MSDLQGWKQEWDEYLAERGLKRRKGMAMAYNEPGFQPTDGRSFKRWVGRTDSAAADNSFQARAFRGGGPAADVSEYLATDWKSPPFADPITAFVCAETCNWGQG